MATTLHILTKSDDVFAKEIIGKEKAVSQGRTDIVDLTSGQPDYKTLLEKIFAADSVQVW